MSTTHILVVDQQFCIKEEQQGPALEALKKAIQERPFIIGVGYRYRYEYPFPSFNEDAALLKATTLQEALALRDWIVATTTNGHITELDTEDKVKVDNHTEEYAFWSVLAPYIEPGYLELQTYENGDHWRWAFDGHNCQYQEPIITWPK